MLSCDLIFIDVNALSSFLFAVIYMKLLAFLSIVYSIKQLEIKSL